MKILEDNDYLIKAFKVHMGINVSFPERRLAPFAPKTLKKYVINGNKLFSNDNSIEHSHILRPIDIPPVAVKCAIYADILQHCGQYHYSTKCIQVENKYGIEHILPLLDGLNQEYDEKSNQLFNMLFNNAPLTGVDDAQLIQGYIKLKRYL